MREKIIELLLKYAAVKNAWISETSGDFSRDRFNLHLELQDMAAYFDTENIDYFRDIYPNLSESIRDTYEEHFQYKKGEK